MNNAKKLLGVLALCSAMTMPSFAQNAEYFEPYRQSDLRLPSVPLLVNDPYFSFWSNYDNLNGGPTRHWSEQKKAIEGILRVDGKSYRFMGIGQENLLMPIAAMTIDGEIWSGRVNHTKQSNSDWARNNYDDSSWDLQNAAWGTANEYPNVSNSWTDTNSDIYVRRRVNLTAEDLTKELWVKFSHDDVFELYINGTRIVSTGETWLQGEERKLNEAQKKLLKVGENIIAAHCHNTTGGAYIDFGLYENVQENTETVELAQQTSVDVMATSSYYTFTCGPVELDIVFTAPMLIDDLDLISTPINYISYQVTSLDGNAHDVQFYLSTTAQLTVNEMSQPTLTSITTQNGIKYAKAGSEEQKILGRSGDMISIDWGYLYIPAINGEVSVSSPISAEATFVSTGKLQQSNEGETRSTSHAGMPIMAFANDLGNVTSASDFMMIGYDEVYDIQYMRKNYKAYYARNGKTIFQAFEELRDNYNDIMDRCRALDKMIYDDGLAAGNVKYAELLSGCYRHVMAAHKLFQDDKGHILYFSKENKSNGCVNTVDLTYPESPLYLLYNPTLQKGMILSILEYALSDERKGKTCAAHDLGQYPLANGQVYGDSMPLEESANILILANAICRVTGDGEWLKPYRNVLKTWANYCRSEGQNPGNQLCTDDFKGPSEQNTNLSIKAIIAVAAYSELVPHIGGNSRDVERFKKYAQDMALLWEADARDGNHYRMEFHKSGTWSQKYNLIWDKLWGLNIFPPQVLDREINFYLSKQEKYGLPLDSRDLQTKSDWIMWTASMSPDTETFLKFADKQYDYVNETTSRIPLSDYFWAHTGVSCNFSARSVIGGLWMKVFMDREKPVVEDNSWAPQGNHIKTRWAAEVDPNNPLPEYPRPLMKRDLWQNLNGLWDYAITGSNSIPGDEFDGQILVPFAIESSLSGVMRPLEPNKALWYKREITVPEDWADKKVILHFGAVDYQADVFIGGTTGRYKIASHIGGHSSFSVDITDKLTDGAATLYVKVIDNTDENAQPVGKQRRYPNGGGDIFYTSTSGIWQTVWMEAVEKAYISNIKATPDIDNNQLTFDVKISGTTEAGQLKVTLKDGEDIVAEQTVTANGEASITFDIASPKLWSTVTPFLYDVTLSFTTAEGTDVVDSYAAMRKISYRQDENGYWRLQLNNSDLFQFGPLDQGYWPDGLMTAPTDEALLYDIKKTKEWGFNMIRKHMKVEPARWYYHCDRLGMLVWQDMPSTFKTDESWVTESWYPDHNCVQNSTLEKYFKEEWNEIIDQLYSHPSIVVWTPFNERWGQFKTAEIVEFTQSLDNTRLVNPASGGNHYKLGEGTFVDQHTYDQPIRVFEGIFDPTRPYVLGEYGGLGRNIPDHRWYDRNSQTYNTYSGENDITNAFVTLANQIHSIAQGYESNGNKISYGAAVYTQTTDVETEVNGIMTYDREIIKFDEEKIRESIQKLTSLYGAEIAGVDDAPFVNGTGERIYYNLMGIRLDSPVPGVNIAIDSDGTVHKFIHK